MTMNNSVSGRDYKLETGPSYAAHLTEYGGVGSIEIVQVDPPLPGPTQVIVRTEAAGINPFDWKLRSGALAGFFPLAFPFVPGLELAGVVVAVGDKVTSLGVGDRVMGELRQAGGAYAQHVAVEESNLCVTPHGLSSLMAGGIPAAALTSWGALQAAGGIKPGQKVLIHGAAGGCGGYAVQFCVAAGAEVYATASTRSVQHVMALGAKRVFERHENPAESLSGLDVVIDMVGDASIDPLWSTLSDSGMLVTIADPNIASRVPENRRGVWYNMVFDKERLREIAEDVASGRLMAPLAGVFALKDLPEGIEQCGTGHPPGKLVVVFP